jgi:triphosphoribosyl-dephospho-CoA synthase
VIDPSTVAAAAQLACLLEVSAPKPGNVSPGRHFADTRYEDFLASAVALSGPLARVGEQPVGRTVRQAIEATAQWTRTNTNLGIVLLFAPLGRAVVVSQMSDSGSSVPRELDAAECALRHLRGAARQVLHTTTVEDARDVYAAIRLARPGGLGEVDAQDVSAEPTATLLEVMRLAAHRDGIASEYATGFETTFERGAPALARARGDGLSWDDAVVETFLTLLAAAPDTHVVRRAGAAAAEDISRRAAAALDAGGVRSASGRHAIEQMDAALRGPRNAGNPGTTADLTAAAIFVFLLAGGWGRSVRLSTSAKATVDPP